MKLKKLLGCISAVMVSAVFFTGNVTAVGTQDYSTAANPGKYTKFKANPPSLSDDLRANDNQVTRATGPIAYLGNLDWSDSMRTQWTGAGPYGGTTTYYRTLTTRLSNTYVYDDPIYLSYYRNHNGTYNNVYAYPIARNTLFMWADVTNYPSYSSSYVEQVTYRDTPRVFDNYDDLDEMGYLIIGWTSSNTYIVIGFLSEYNPLFYYGWDSPTFG